VPFINAAHRTFELKNSLTKQTVEDAKEQYRATAIRASCLPFGRCVVHLAVDDHEVWMCTTSRQSVLVPALQSGLEHAPATRPTRWVKTGLSVAAHPHPTRPHRHPGELCQIVGKKDEKTGKKKRDNLSR